MQRGLERKEALSFRINATRAKTRGNQRASVSLFLEEGYKLVTNLMGGRVVMVHIGRKRPARE